jgi:FkbM family methyltransferase
MSVAVKRRTAPLVRAVAPHRFWRRKYRILQCLGAARPEIELARSLCDPNRTSLDIGADVGEFSIAMAASSRAVIAFEPRPAQARALTAMFEAAGAAVRVEPLALSDRFGVTAMRVWEAEPGRSTIDTGNTLDDAEGGGVDSIAVQIRRLDDLQLGDVGFVKIDVEGHELAVLRGAVNTLTRNRPVLLVEAEERHHPHAVAATTEFLAELGYTGYFELDGIRRPIDEFDVAVHQDSANVAGAENGWAARGVYVNNFVFLPRPS